MQQALRRYGRALRVVGASALAALAPAATAGASASGASLTITAVKRHGGFGHVAEMDFWIKAAYPANLVVYFDYGITKPHKRCPATYNEADSRWHGREGGTLLPPGGSIGPAEGRYLPKGKYRLCGYLADNNSAIANPPLATATKVFKVTHVGR